MAYTLPGLGGGGTYNKADLSGASVTPTTSLVKPTTTTTSTTTPPPIAVDTMTEPTAPYQLPPPPTEPDSLGALAAVPTIEEITTETPSATETTQNTLMSQILESVGKITGREAAQINAEKAAGLPQLNTQLTDVNNQIQALQKEAAAIPLQIQEQFAGRGATQGGVAPIQAGQLRQNAIKALGLSAIAQTLQGNVALAQSQADRAVELEFAPQEARLTFLSKALELNSKLLDREDSKRAAVIQAKLSERARLLAEQKLDKTSINTVLLKAAEYGADQQTLSRVRNATTYADAIAAASKFLQDPKAKYELESARLDNILKNAQIANVRANTAQIGKPTRAEIAAENAAIEAAKNTVPVLSDKLTLVKSLINHKGLNSSVGTTKLGRFAITDKFTGQKQDFIAGVEQLVSKDTMDTLINLKSQGGTLGALSDGERQTLQAAATRLGTWAIKKDGQTVGYNASEQSVKNELGKIQELTERAYKKAGGVLITTDERAAMNALYSGGVGTTASVFNPEAYFSN